MPCAKEPPNAMLCYMLKDLLKDIVSFKIRVSEMSNLLESIYTICLKLSLICIHMYLNTSVFTSFLEKEWVTLIVFKLYFSHEINCRKRILICAQTSIKFSIILGVLLTETCFIKGFTLLLSDSEWQKTWA